MRELVKKLNIKKIVFVAFLLGASIGTLSIYTMPVLADGDEIESGSWVCPNSCNGNSCSTPPGDATPTCSGISTETGNACLVSCVKAN